MNSQFGGGCPICGGKNTLSNVGRILKPCIECSACKAKFEQSIPRSPKYTLVEGNSEYLGKEYTLNEWSLVRTGNLGGGNVQPLKPHQVAITSEYSVEITRDKTTAIFKGLGFEIDRTEDGYYAHKGNLFIALFAGFLVPKCDIYYSLSEAEGKTVINMRTPIGFWKGGGALGMAKQESIFREVVAVISSNLTSTVEEKAMNTTPVAGAQFCPNCGIKVSETQRFCPECGTNLITGVAVKKATIARKIGAAVCIAFGLFMILFGLAGFAYSMEYDSSPQAIIGTFAIAIGFGITWFGWSHRR